MAQEMLYFRTKIMNRKCQKWNFTLIPIWNFVRAKKIQFVALICAGKCSSPTEGCKNVNYYDRCVNNNHSDPADQAQRACGHSLGIFIKNSSRRTKANCS